LTRTSAARRLKVEDLDRDGAHVLVLSGELDTASVPILEAAISRLHVDRTTTITLDLRNLRFIDSAGLWTITRATKWCAREGYGFSLIPGPEPIQGIFELTGLSDVLPFRPAK
jgi:anti-sigma B factor antagonist